MSAYEYRLIERLAEEVTKKVVERLREKERVLAVEPKAIAEAIRDELGRIRIPLDYQLALHVLTELELAQPVVLNEYRWLNPGEVASLTFTVPKGRVYVFRQSRFACDPDHALSLHVYADGKLVFWDNDMVLTRYIHPLTFADTLGIVVAKERGELVARNKAGSTAYFSHLTILANVKADMWSAVAEAISDIIAGDLRLPTVLRRTG
jgi:hypothetical protein